MFLDVHRVRDETRAELFGHLLHHPVVIELAPSLHHPNDRRLNLGLAVVLDAHSRLALLRLALAARAHRPDLDLEELRREPIVEDEHVVVVHLLAHRLLPQHVSPLDERQRLQRPLQILRGDTRLADDIPVAHPVALVEQQEDAHLVRADVELALGLSERRSEIRGAHVRQPRQPPAVVTRQIKLPELVARLGYLPRDVALGHVSTPGGGPAPRREHLHGEVDPPQQLRDGGARGHGLLLQSRSERRHRVSAGAHVVEHPLDLARELIPALRLEFDDEAALGVVAGGASAEQALGKVLFVVPLEDVLLLQESKQRHRPVERRLYLLLRRLLEALSQPLVHVEGDVLRCSGVEVHEVLERLVQRVDERAIASEGEANDVVVLRLHPQQPLHERHRILPLLRIRHERLPLLLDVLGHHLFHGRQSSVHAPVQLVHQRQLVVLVVGQHAPDARVGHPEHASYASREELRLRHRHHTGFRPRVEVFLHARVFLVQTPLAPPEILVAVARPQESLRFDPVKLRRRRHEVLLEILHVHVFSDVHQHRGHRAHEGLIDAFTLALAFDRPQHRLSHPGVDAGVSRDVIPPEREAEVVDGFEAVRRHVDAVHVHQDVSNHAHGLDVILPPSFELGEETLAADGVDRGRHLLEMLRHDVHEAVVERLAVSVEDHVVGVAVELLEGEAAGVAVVDLADGISEDFPGLLRVLRRGAGEGRGRGGGSVGADAGIVGGERTSSVAGGPPRGVGFASRARRDERRVGSSRVPARRARPCA